MKNQNVHISQKKRIRSFSVDKNELRKLMEILQERAYAAAELEEKHLNRLDDQTEEEFEKSKKDLKEGFKLFITLSGIDGRKLTGDIDEIFDSPNYPLARVSYLNAPDFRKCLHVKWLCTCNPMP